MKEVRIILVFTGFSKLRAPENSKTAYATVWENIQPDTVDQPQFIIHMSLKKKSDNFEQFLGPKKITQT